MGKCRKACFSTFFCFPIFYLLSYIIFHDFLACFSSASLVHDHFAFFGRYTPKYHTSFFMIFLASHNGVSLVHDLHDFAWPYFICYFGKFCQASFLKIFLSPHQDCTHPLDLQLDLWGTEVSCWLTMTLFSIVYVFWESFVKQVSPHQECTCPLALQLDL